MFGRDKSSIVDAADALPGRDAAMPIPDLHDVLGTPIAGPFPEGSRQIVFGMGCFWGAERKFWELDGVITTAVGYAGGHTPNPTYEETCTGLTGHTEAVLVVYDPARVSFDELLTTFWENHDPTQGMRQGNDRGSQYRSAIYTTGADQLAAATASQATYQERLEQAGYGEITTEIRAADGDPPVPFFYAEGYHQQYLAKNPMGYCGIGGTGVSCPIGLAG